MDEILISVYVLALDEEYDIFISINEKVSHILDLIQMTIKELSGTYYQISKNAKLYNGVDGTLVNVNNIVKFSGLTNGGRLLLLTK